MIHVTFDTHYITDRSFFVLEKIFYLHQRKNIDLYVTAPIKLNINSSEVVQKKKNKLLKTLQNAFFYFNKHSYDNGRDLFYDILDDRTIKLNSMNFTTLSMSDNEIKKFRFLVHEFNDVLVNDEIKKMDGFSENWQQYIENIVYHLMQKRDYFISDFEPLIQQQDYFKEQHISIVSSQEFSLISDILMEN